MQLVTYLTFDGTCDEALSFYAEALGGEVLFAQHFRDMPDQDWNPGPEHGDRVLHARLAVGGQVVMASDSFPGQPVSHGGFSLSLQFQDVGDARSAFERLSAGGEITMPLEATFWAKIFGTCRDRFGVSWMVNVDLDRD